jgi:tetratricopeptide (TPR) repeat protein
MNCPGGSDGQQQLNSAISERKTGEIMMLATGAGQESLEDASIGSGHGLFTYYLVDGLSGLADTKGNSDQRISLKELQRYIGANVPSIAQEKYKRKQDPFFCCTESDNTNIALVDSSFMRKWTAMKDLKELSGNEMDAIARTVRTRSIDSNRNDTQYLATFRDFNRAIKKMQLVGKDSSAEFYLLQLNRFDPLNILTREAQATLAAEFINYAQTKINLYLQGKDAIAVQQMRSQFDEEQSDEMLLVFNRMEKIAKQEFTETAVLLEKAIALLKGLDSSLAKALVAKVYFFRAHGFFDKGNKTMDFNQALDYAHKANLYDHNAAYTLNTLSSLYNQHHIFDSAVHYAKKAIAVAPQWRYPYLNTAYAYTKLNKRDSALNYYLQAIKIDSSNADAFVDIGRFYYESRKLDSAKLLYEKALKLDPKNVSANNNMGWILKERRQYMEAINHFKICIENDATTFSAYNGLSKVFSSIKQYDSARFYYEKAMQRYPDK